MKKFIVFALFFSVSTGSAFAQLTFSGSVYAGIQLEIPYDTNEDESISAHHRTEGAPVFNFIATVSRENFGARLDTSFSTDFSSAGEVSIDGIYGWIDFLNNALRFTMGRISSPVWVANLDPDNLFYFDKITGFRLEYSTPLPGLRVGAAFRTEGITMGQFIRRPIFGATYFHPLFNAVLAYNMGSNGHLLFGFNFTGIPDLTTAGIQVRVGNIASWDDPGFGGSVEIKQKVGYRIMRPLTASLLMGQRFFAEPLGDFQRRNTELFFTPSVSYTILPNLTGTFSVELFFAPDNFEETRVITLNPRIEYMLRGPALLYFGYELRLARYKQDSHHRISVGIEIRAF